VLREMKALREGRMAFFFHKEGWMNFERMEIRTAGLYKKRVCFNFFQEKILLKKGIFNVNSNWWDY
jgi:hypothetical protein